MCNVWDALRSHANNMCKYTCLQYAQYALSLRSRCKGVTIKFDGHSAVFRAPYCITRGPLIVSQKGPLLYHKRFNLKLCPRPVTGVLAYFSFGSLFDTLPIGNVIRFFLRIAFFLGRMDRRSVRERKEGAGRD